MPTLTIDGKSVTVPAGTTVFNACKQTGTYVPNYCYHPALQVAGNCRICQVEIKGQPKPAISCNTPCTEGMEVFTRSDKALKARKGVMEFLLVNHPLDCPTCDQAGECELQDFAAKENQLTSRFDEEKILKDRVDFGPHVQYVPNRCILCTRCVRVCDDIIGESALGVVQRGAHAEIALFPGSTVVNNPLFTNVVDVCPVGALLTKDHLHQGRAWFLKRTPTTCPSCSRGCSVFVDSFRDHVTRVRPRHNEKVNDYWVCDIGRHQFREYLQSPQRLTTPLHQGKPVSWEEALAVLKANLPGAASVGSAWATSEENLLLGKLARPAGMLAAGDGQARTFKSGFKIDADRNPNRRGASAAGFPDKAAWPSGALLLLDLIPGHAPTDAELASWNRASFKACLSILPSAFAKTADLVLPVAAFAETEGTYVNSQGQAQWVRPAVKAPGQAQEAWRILAVLAGLKAGRVQDIHAMLPEAVREGAVPVPAAATA